MSGEGNPMYGKPAKNKGGHITQEQKDKISMANKGKSSNKGYHWKLVNGKRVYYKDEE